MTKEEFMAMSLPYNLKLFSSEGKTAILTSGFGISIGRYSYEFSYEWCLRNEYGYKLHLWYGCKAAPSERSHATVNDSPEPQNPSNTTSPGLEYRLMIRSTMSVCSGQTWSAWRLWLWVVFRVFIRLMSSHTESFQLPGATTIKVAGSRPSSSSCFARAT